MTYEEDFNSHNYMKQAWNLPLLLFGMNYLDCIDE